jgi:nucleoside phosphorylase
MAALHLHREDYTVGWVCALPVELAAAQEMLDEVHKDLYRNANESTIYTLGRIGEHNVVIACLPEGQTGTNSAAVVAQRMGSAFPSIQYRLMVGIGGGVPSKDVDIRLGDVVVSRPEKGHGGVVQYDFGKATPSGFVRTGFLNAPPAVLLDATANLRANHMRGRNRLLEYASKLNSLPKFARDNVGPDILFKANYEHIDGPECDRCSKENIVTRQPRSQEIVIHYGTIASGNQVMRTAVERDKVSEELGSVLCFEMEAAGLMNSFPCIVIRGICDYSDSHKNKTWQPYAAGTAAAYAKELLSMIPTAEVAKPHTDVGKYQTAFTLEGIPRVKSFIDRPVEMAELEQILLAKRQRQKVFVLHGLGGIGKTQLAVEFMRSHHHKFSSVFWLDGSSEDSLRRSFASHAARISHGEISDISKAYSGGEGGGGGGGGDINAVVAEVMSWLAQPDNTDWLLVFDNVDREYEPQTPEPGSYDIRRYFSGADHGSILITTRLARLTQLGDSQQVKKVDHSQAQAILESWYKGKYGRSTLSHDMSKSRLIIR